MPARTGRTTYIPGRGATTRGKSGKAKTFTGKGPAPSGTKKVAEPSYTEVPTVTVSSKGTTATGFKRQRAAQSAKRRARRITAETQKRSRQTEQKAKTAEMRVKARRYEPNPAKAIISTTPNPAAKPPTFKGTKTAGTPTREELQTAFKAGTLKVNKKGFATTPQVRKVGGELKRLRVKARRSSAPLPGLGPAESKNARTVLRRGEKKRATRKEKLAAITTGLVEAPNFKNPAGGDADSEGWRQERTSIYGTGPQGPRNVRASADRFFEEVRTDAGTDTAPTPGLLAQAAQGSAFPERYDERLPEARAILKAHNQGGLKPAQRKQLAATQAKAAKLGLRVAKPSKLGPPPKRVVKRYKAGRMAMAEVDKAGFNYSWAGGHNATFAPIGEEGEGYDCSGAVSYALHKMGVLDAPLTSGDMGSALKPGPGALTVFYNPTHTFMYDAVKGEYWGTSGSNPGGGAGYFPKSVGDSQVASGEYSVGHVPGLGKKQAIQMGGSLGKGAFPGMTVSSSGTTATINEGAGATVKSPGFSKAPIKLTQTQKARRTFRRLKEAGVGVEKPDEELSETMKRLEAKYGKAAA